MKQILETKVFSTSNVLTAQNIDKKLAAANINVSVNKDRAKKMKDGVVKTDNSVKFINDSKTKIPLKCNNDEHNDKENKNISSSGKLTLQKVFSAINNESKKPLCSVCAQEKGVTLPGGSTQEMWAFNTVKKFIDDNNMEGYIVYPLTTSLKKKLNVLSITGKRKLDVDVYVEFPKDIAEKCGKTGVGFMIDGPTHTGVIMNATFRNDKARENDATIYLVRVGVIGASGKEDEEGTARKLDEEHIKKAVNMFFNSLKNYLTTLLPRENEYKRPISKEAKENVPTYKQAIHTMNKVDNQKKVEMLKRLINTLQNRDMITGDDSNKYLKYKEATIKKKKPEKARLSEFLNSTLGHQSYMKYPNEWEEIAGNDISPEKVEKWKKTYQSIKPGEKLFDKNNLKLFEDKK